MTDHEPTNEERADRAQAALDAYAKHKGEVPDESDISDLLCDLMHLARRECFAFNEAFQTAQMNFNEESR